MLIPSGFVASEAYSDGWMGVSIPLSGKDGMRVLWLASPFLVEGD
jgi:hypothetical protein